MNEIQLEEILDFRKVISMINQELASKNIFNIEYLLINNSIEDIVKVVVDNSYYYNLIKNDSYSNGATFHDLFEMYCLQVKKAYNSLCIDENTKNIDTYFNKLKEPTRLKGQFLQFPKNTIEMKMQEVQKTLLLMREAILAYYNVYYNKMLIAELSTKNPEESEYLEFVIKEEQLLHLLGVTINQLKNNPDFIRLTGNKHMNSVEILKWIVKDTEGNNDLLQYNEDFLKRMSKSKLALVNSQFEKETKTRILNYHKIRAKSQTFLKYGPFEKVSLVAKLQDGKKLTVNSKSNSAMISHADSFKKYPWAYFGSVQTQKDKYVETLLIDSAEGKKNLFKGSKPAIVKGVYLLDSNIIPPGSGGYVNIFSEEEQFNLFLNAYESFRDTMDFENLKEYFLKLSEAYSNQRRTNR